MVPTFNHTRGDSSLWPCPACFNAMSREERMGVEGIDSSAPSLSHSRCPFCLNHSQHRDDVGLTLHFKRPCTSCIQNGTELALLDRIMALETKAGIR